MKLKVLTTKTKEPDVLGTFGKGIDGSFSLNYGISSGKNCDISCPHHYDSSAENATKACYATRSEAYRIGLRNKLQKHEDIGADYLTKKALSELQGKIKNNPDSVKWLRISVSGSVPQPKDITHDFRDSLRELMTFCNQQNIPIHFPVETNQKARVYRRIVGNRAIVRESCHTEEQFVKTDGAVSFVAGNTDMSKSERIEDAKRIAGLRRNQLGRKTIVCPAVAAKYITYERAREKGMSHKEAQQLESSPLAKCGNCTACAEENIDVIYPLH